MWPLETGDIDWKHCLISLGIGLVFMFGVAGIVVLTR